MTSTPGNRSTDQAELALIGHLIGRLQAQVSGRDGVDIVEGEPSRTIFCGVLHAVQEDEIERSKNLDLPSGTSIGLEFRIRPDSGGGPLALRISPWWSHYYAVFPDWEQAREMNGTKGKAAPAPQPSACTPIKSGDPKSDERDEDSSPYEVDDDNPADGGGAVQTEKDGPPLPQDDVVLGRVFRRSDIKIAEIEVPLALDLPRMHQVAQAELADVIQSAREKMASDPASWKHLSEPKDRERRLGPQASLTSRESYQAALAAHSKEPVALPQWQAALHVDASPDLASPGAIRVCVLLSNRTLRVFPGPDDPALVDSNFYDASLRVEIVGGAIHHFRFHLAPEDYKCKPEMPAKGVNCSAAWSSETPRVVITDTMPLFLQPSLRTREEVIPMPFSTLASEHGVEALEELSAHMTTYLKSWDAFLEDRGHGVLSDDELRACRKERDDFHAEIGRFVAGVTILKTEPHMARAFRLMNTLFERLGKRTNIDAWRLFQIVFIVSQLSSLSVREKPRDATDAATQDMLTALDEIAVLWFPTGGGKTEAYLGLIAIGVMYDRLRGKTRGITAWMRFPLRMLSLQQLERLSRVIAELNVLREQEPDLAVGDPISMGYYVGSTTTPNYIGEKEALRLEGDPAARERFKLLRRCPFCGSEVNVKFLRASWRLAHVCPNAACLSNQSSTLGRFKGSLPVCIVDSEVYRYLPSVVVSTVDKLAIAGISRHFALLVNGATEECKLHGYCSYGECTVGPTCTAGKRAITRLEPVKDPGPSLLIQDELHLLKAELGAFNGHYEGLLRYLSRKAYLPPKVLAATATIEDYDIQAYHLYLGKAVRFPSPGWQDRESFYATCQPLRLRRHYVGLLSHRKSIVEIAVRLLDLYHRELRLLQESPVLARQVFRDDSLSDADIQGLLRMHDFALCYVNRKPDGGGVHLQVTEKGLTSYCLTGDNPPETVGEVLERIESERDDLGHSRLQVLAATNMISHGVDLERINMMVVCGMPSHYAEFIQSTSRAARSRPGVVFVCFNARDPRETSQFEFFRAMHEHMDRLIESPAINRYASFVPQKTVPGLLSGILLSDISPKLFSAKKIKRPLSDIKTLRGALRWEMAPGAPSQPDACIDEGQLRAAIYEVMGIDRVRPPAMQAQITHLQAQTAEVLSDCLSRIGRSTEKNLLDEIKPLTSFRDVDEGIDFGSVRSAAIIAEY